MDSANEIKEVVREKYGKLAVQSTQSGCCGSTDVSCFADDYTQLAGYVAEADLGLGCGVPTEIAQMKPGDTVLDLGSGAGNDVFVARAIVGDSGRVIGVDMTEAMIEKARANGGKLGYTNIEFRFGEIEALPVDDNSIDVVISNCVLNLVPSKEQAFSEIWRVLKPGGHFSISDIIVEGELPEAVRRSAEAYVGCVAGAMPKTDYLGIIEQAGFTARIAKQKRLSIPDELLQEIMSAEEAREFQESNNQLVSVTVYGEKRA